MDTDAPDTTAPTRRPRLVAITAAGDAVPRTFARLVGALRDRGAEVIPLPVPSKPPAPRREAAPSFADLKRFARDIIDTVRGDDHEPAGWIPSQLQAIQGHVDAVVAVDPRVAGAVFPHVAAVWPRAVRVAVDSDYHLDPEWADVPFDDLVVPHLGVAPQVGRVREGRARLREGGPLIAQDATAKRADEARPQVVVSFARLDPGDVDPLLFQLSLARPERFDLLFLPSGRAGVDELVRTRAGNYGLRGKRTRAGADAEPWIRGAAALIGHASPDEVAVAVTAGVPLLFFSPEARLSSGDRFLLDHGAARNADVPITIAVELESLLPGGAQRDAALQALAKLEPTGSGGAAGACLDAAAEGRPPAPAAAAPDTTEPASAFADELEDIGGEPTMNPEATADIPLRLRRAYLTEIILQQNQVQKQLARARSGLASWQRRVQLARAAGDGLLAERALPRVEGLQKLVDRLGEREAELGALQGRFASREPLSAADRAAAARFMRPEIATQLDRGEAPESAFTRLEIEDALSQLKRRIDKS